MSDFVEMDPQARRHVSERLQAACRRTNLALKGRGDERFDPLGHLDPVLQSPQSEFRVDLAQIANNYEMQFPGCNSLDDTLLSRAAFGHVVGTFLHTEPPHRSRFEGVFVETAHDLEVAAGWIGLPQALEQGSDERLMRIANAFEPQLPPTDLPDLVAPQMSAYFLRSAFTTLLEKYVPPTTGP